MRDRRAAYAVAAAFVAAAFAFPAIAAAESAEEGAVVESPAPSPEWPWSHWTKERLEQAEPMPIVTLPGPGPGAESEATANPQVPAGTESAASSEAQPAARSEGASTAAVRYAATGRTAAIEGVETTAAESTVFPSSANGKVFGSYYVRLGAHEFEREDYVCSGSVVHSELGNLILTAGHCVIEPETGTPTSSELIFIPGYRNGSAPFGVWKIEKYAITETWKNTAKAGSRPNEGGDLAFIELQDNDEGESVEKAVRSSYTVGFDQPCNQTYTQFGYPAESPYSGELLYSHTAAYAGADTNGGFTPTPMKIASDFTRGASGGPWAVGIGTGTPTVSSLTAYGYESQPGYLYGPYFGEAAKKTYDTITKYPFAAGIEESCTALPVNHETTIETPIPTPTPPSPTPTPPQPEATPAVTPVTLKVTRVRRRANGSAVLTAMVNTAGMLKLSGTAVRAESLDTHAAGQYRLVVAPKKSTNRLLLQRGRAKVGVKVAFMASGKTKRISRSIQLSRRLAGQPAPQPATQSH